MFLFVCVVVGLCLVVVNRVPVLWLFACVGMASPSSRSLLHVFRGPRVGLLSLGHFWEWPVCLRAVCLSRRLLPVCLPVPAPRSPHAVWLDVFLLFRCFHVLFLLAPCGIRRPLLRGLVFNFWVCLGRLRRPKYAHYPISSSLLLVFSPFLFSLLFSFASLLLSLFSPFAWAGCGALSTHTHSLSLSFSFSLALVPPFPVRVATP